MTANHPRNDAERISQDLRKWHKFGMVKVLISQSLADFCIQKKSDMAGQSLSLIHI